MQARAYGEELLAPINKGKGLTASEQVLADLSERTFMGLWSYPNVYKSPGQELCDLLVVCGDDVIIFSDKTIEWSGEDIKTSWPRWYKKAVKKSADQVVGAARWISEFQDRIFLDAACTNPFPFELPSPDRRRVHSVCVALGSEAAASKFFGDDDGTMMILPHLKGDDHIDFEADGHITFAIGDVRPDKNFIHVFNQRSLKVVMVEMDTISDFVSYLKDRADFIRGGTLTVSPSEAELVAHYLQHTRSGKRAFPTAADAGGDAGFQVSYLQGEYAAFIRSDEYKFKKKADRISYAWDTLIGRFGHHVVSDTAYKILEVEPDAVLAERALRIMAGEDRFARRLLGSAFVGAVQALHDQKKDRLGRVVMPCDAFARNDQAYVFMALSSSPFDSYERYREARASMLETYCLSVLHDYREIAVCVGIAIDALSNDGTSEDLIAIEQLEWTLAEEASLAEAREAYEIMIDPSALVPVKTTHAEYASTRAPLTRQQRRAAERAQKKRERRFD